MKTDIILLADDFEKFTKVSTKDQGIRPLYSICICSYTLQCCLKYTKIKLQTLEDKFLSLLIENNFRGGTSSVMCARYINSDENKKIVYINATKFFGHSMSLPLPFEENKFERNVCLKEILNTPDDNDIGFLLEVDLKHPYNIGQKTKRFPFCPENKITSKVEFNDYMKKIKQKNYAEQKKLNCDWTAKKKKLIHYRALKFYVRHGMVFHEVLEVI